jgi:hypothetical protein
MYLFTPKSYIHQANGINSTVSLLIFIPAAAFSSDILPGQSLTLPFKRFD